jgi:hypothetical protein
MKLGTRSNSPETWIYNTGSGGSLRPEAFTLTLGWGPADL